VIDLSHRGDTLGSANAKRIIAMFTRIAALVAVAATLGATSLSAQDFSEQVGARQGQFKLFGANLGPLFMMGTGRAEYDAGAAQAAADNLVKLSSLDQRGLWPEGSDAGAIDGTRARAEIWQNPEDFAAKLVALNEAAVEIAAVASDGQEAIGGQLRNLSGTCSACHDAYRAAE
jgi:cytochrome c556